ncbi:MAG TPA: D-glycero-beta-D-manno-heptose-7-phosphate kinase [Deltaproteobacteria bacterium]|jgi:rfaE bifunctional protein kinase chain/domain|nr:D-glycero-beta-D-manno-heptose-7-phosphate kinase [Deltaproteobacteria bacterium]HOD70882.1 D-glycero-beta-D-manno-heptose-7-phosphate kinase [Deltaproteobacteria bacterium]HRR19871.1 D-glycero-beta-D-manno-heptose-7-phosphate kinase [Desulfomonilia bacterium]HRR67928.1 D-glycero-beta-D-manno-heptose-7-phosphate kinase [Desulfomonilia bacterium]HRT43645.1 D-glycero-beta-D-manno-heptose-7-phosphate kinase [Desulfomonilia bacterium]
MLKIDQERLKSIFEAMRSKTIMVIGDLMLDHYIWGKVERISPEAPVPVVEVHEEKFKLGGAGNVANNLLSLGASVIISGVKGKDSQGDVLIEILKNSGIPTGKILTDPIKGTIVKTRIIAHTQQIVRLDREDRSVISEDLRKELVREVQDCMPRIDAIIISDYAKGVVSRELIREVVELTKNNGVIVCVDPKERNFPFYKNIDVITPNIKELSFGAGIKIETYHDIIEAAGRIKSSLACDIVLVTRGEHGMSLFEKDNEAVDIPTTARAVFDVTGAGDTVIACFTLALVSGASPREAAIIANTAAGLVVAEVGAASVPWEKLYRTCREEVSGNTGHTQ